MDRSFRPYLAELIGTFAVVFVSAGAVCVTYLVPVLWQAPSATNEALAVVTPQPSLLAIALAAGLIYAGALAATLPYSDGYLNPAVPFALWVFKRIDSGKTIGLIFVQLLGAAAAGGALRAIFWFREDMLTAISMATPHVNLRAFDVAGPNLRVLATAIGLEMVLTFILTFLIFALLIDPRATRFIGHAGRRLACLWLGLALAAATFAAFPLTGAALNPARWFGTVVWEMTITPLQLQHPFRDQVVYWFGPILGALVAGALYTYVILPEEEDHAVTTTPAPTPAKAASSATLFRSKSKK
jgi:glycerol uptake facilitator-like aquaporin